MVTHHLAAVMPPKDPTDVNNNAYHMHKQRRNYGLNYCLHACEYNTMRAQIEREFTVNIMIILILSPAEHVEGELASSDCIFDSHPPSSLNYGTGQHPISRALYNMSR